MIRRKIEAQMLARINGGHAWTKAEDYGWQSTDDLHALQAENLRRFEAIQKPRERRPVRLTTIVSVALVAWIAVFFAAQFLLRGWA